MNWIIVCSLFVCYLAASVALFVVSIVFFRRASAALRTGEGDADRLRIKKNIWLAILILSSMLLALSVLAVIWLVMIYVLAIFFM